MPIDPSATSESPRPTAGGTPTDLLDSAESLAPDAGDLPAQHDVPRTTSPRHARTRRPRVLLLVAGGLGLWTAGLWAGLRVAGDQNRSADLAGTRATFTTELSPAESDFPTSVTSVFGGGPVGEALRLHRAAVDRAKNQPQPARGVSSPTSAPVDPAAQRAGDQASKKGV